MFRNKPGRPGRLLYAARRALHTFLLDRERPRWAALTVVVSLLVLFAVSRFPLPSGSPTCHIDSLPAAFHVVYCGDDLIAAKHRYQNDGVVVYDARDRSRTWPHSFVNFVMKQAGPAHMKIVETILKNDFHEVLVLGLGGAAIPFVVAERCSDCSVVGVDISPDALTIARHFVKHDGPGERLEYVLDDADLYVKKTTSRSYEVVVADLSVGSRTPEFVFTPTFIGNVHRLVRNGGQFIVALYVPPDADPGKLLMYSTLSRVFKSVVVLDSDDNDPNFVLVATK